MSSSSATHGTHPASCTVSTEVDSTAQTTTARLRTLMQREADEFMKVLG
jgi:hypothetical protein